MFLPILAAAAQTVSVAAAGPPAEAVYFVDQGPNGREGEIERLLAAWSRFGVVRRRRPQNQVNFDSCISGQPWIETDADCVRRLLPAPSDGVPALAVVARDSGRRNLVWEITCVGPSGFGRVSVSSGHLFRTHVGTRNEARGAIATCLSSALRGAARFQPDPLPEPRRVNLPSTGRLPADLDEARRTAAEVVIVSADHVGGPAPGNPGRCSLRGWVIRVERGGVLCPAPAGGGTLVDVNIPCGNPPMEGERQIARDWLQKGSLVRLYLGGNLALLHAEPVQ